MQVTARFKVEAKTGFPDGFSVTMRPVINSDPNNPNYSFSKWTPSGLLELSITNPSTFDFFQVGEEIDILMTKK